MVYSENAIKRLLHIKSHLESGLNVNKKIENIKTGSGDLSSCASGLSSHAFATAIYSWFECGDLNKFKQWLFVASKLEQLYYKYQEASPDWGRGFPHLFKPLFSDNDEVILFISQYDAAYDSSRTDDPITSDFLAYQSIVAIRKDWGRLASRCKVVIDNSDNALHQKNNILDFRFFLALSEGDINGMEEIISLILSAKERPRRAKNEGGYTRDLIATDAAIYSKIAWRSGYFLKVNSFYVPQEWLPVSPLGKYDAVYDFLNI